MDYRLFVLTEIRLGLVSVELKEVVGSLFISAESKGVRTAKGSGSCRELAGMGLGAS